ncbi:succinate dehydrogenase domain protein [Mycobacterium kansasii]|uniref:Succinate dehydrogenase domain protein n=1 Tax=Mycobacterium kansasii TaxID=1768 RepID=A0A1V3X653_MYCKA|nr:succinate dehydrogenase domain protein [Mycobacterium kansasii]
MATRCPCRRHRRRQHGDRSATQASGEFRRANPLRDRATELIVDGLGAVTGVMWKRFSETGAIKAKSVIIAAGDS